MEIIGYFFFTLISKYIDSEFFRLSEIVNENLARGVLPIIIILMTIYYMLAGIRMAFGDSSETMRELLFRTLKTVFIVAVISTSTFFATTLQNTILGARLDITNIFHTGAGANIYEQIDSNLDSMAISLAVVDGVSTGSDVGLSESKGRALTLSLLGQASPPMIAGMLLLINELGLRIAIMLAPLFFLAFMFKRTEDIFYTWLRFMVGSMFSLGILSMVVGIMSDLTIRFGAALVTLKSLIYTANILGWSSANLPQLNESVMTAGFGVVMSVMLLMVPVIVTRFFGSDMGAHIYNAFSGYGASPNSDVGRSQVSASDTSAASKQTSTSIYTSGGFKTASTSQTVGSQVGVTSVNPASVSPGYRGIATTNSAPSMLQVPANGGGLTLARK